MCLRRRWEEGVRRSYVISVVLESASSCSCRKNGAWGRLTGWSLRDHSRLPGGKTGELLKPEPDILMAITAVLVLSQGSTRTQTHILSFLTDQDISKTVESVQQLSKVHCQQFSFSFWCFFLNNLSLFVFFGSSLSLLSNSVPFFYCTWNCLKLLLNKSIFMSHEGEGFLKVIIPGFLK